MIWKGGRSQELKLSDRVQWNGRNQIESQASERAAVERIKENS